MYAESRFGDYTDEIDKWVIRNEKVDMLICVLS